MNEIKEAAHSGGVLELDPPSKMAGSTRIKEELGKDPKLVKEIEEGQTQGYGPIEIIKELSKEFFSLKMKITPERIRHALPKRDRKWVIISPFTKDGEV